MKYLGVAGVLLGLSLLGVPALADEAKQPVPRVGQVVIESMGPASGTIPKGKLAWAQALGARWRASAWGTPLTAGGNSSKARLCICIAG